MSLREENEKRDRQLKKEADLFRTGFNAGLDAAVEAVKSCERIMWQPKIDKDNPPILDSDVDSDSVIKAINKLRYEK